MYDLCIRLPYEHYGVSEEAFLGCLDEMVEQAFDDQCTGTNPRYPLMKEFKNRRILSLCNIEKHVDTQHFFGFIV